MKNRVAEKAELKAYEAPTLVVYGKVSDLTQDGGKGKGGKGRGNGRGRKGRGGKGGGKKGRGHGGSRS
jgi:hypothetical protein